MSPDLWSKPLSESAPLTSSDLDAAQAAVVAAASSPASASNETGSVTTRSVSDLIALDKYLAAKKACEEGVSSGLIVGKFGFPGAV